MSRRSAGLGMIICLAALVAGALAQQPPAQTQKPIRILTFQLQRNRLRPAQLTVPEGRYMVNLVNSYVRGQLNLTWRDDKNAQVAAANMSKGSPRARMYVQLTPGKHVLQVAGKPNWKCDVTVVKDK